MYNYNRAVKYVELQKLPETSRTITRWNQTSTHHQTPPDRRLVWDFQPVLSNSSHKSDFIVTVHSFQNLYAIQIVEKLNAANTFQRYVNSKQQLTACHLFPPQQLWATPAGLASWLVVFEELGYIQPRLLKASVKQLTQTSWLLGSSIPPSNVTLLSAAEQNDAGECSQQERPHRGDGQETWLAWSRLVSNKLQRIWVWCSSDTMSKTSICCSLNPTARADSSMSNVNVKNTLKVFHNVIKTPKQYLVWYDDIDIHKYTEWFYA